MLGYPVLVDKVAVGGLPVFNVVVVKFYINCMVAINRCMIVLVLILIYTSLTVNYSYLRIIRLTWFYSITRHRTSLRFTFKFFTEVLFLSIIPYTLHIMKEQVLP